MAFGQGVVVTGGYRSCSAVQCGATVTTALTHQPPFFVALIRTYTRVHKRFASLMLKPVRTPVAIFGSLGVCIYVPASRHWLISYSPVHLN